MAFFLTNGIIIAVVFIILSGLKVVKEYERGVKFTLGKYSGIMKPGLRLIIPLFQSWDRVDMRVKAVDVPDQDCITKDNVSVRVNAVLYFKIADSKLAILSVENYFYATSQLSQTTMRDVVGEVSLDDLLSKRDVLSKRIQQLVDKATDPWGIKVDSVDLKHIELPQDMKRMMAREAESEREKRAVIIKASGEAIAADNMAKAAKMLATAPGALHLRTLQSINDISSDQSNTVIFAMPLEILKAFEGFTKKGKK
ncbi:slipin family protein [Candidatus Woesearchaeota archaeon]|jgi:regulator of protease activity HflC (stomatin/prohibitin superfamily)|nr:slipin family protein [Candidatus Woesearchaeota archaeon]MBT4150817.1 slipin family protein [Candidatus Woesearchaeota archaeon]MBT4246922.1 slipin family protein [Candidatus Woesearchaeota archaeon]MBT4433607.1 slipin family protein [Candidatus Woesearchaeota archaeon]MBT7331789.1 slipin family protein [Candidatus Woesearchaeota archaeon]